MTDVYRIPYASCYCCSYNLTYPECAAHCASVLRDIFKRTVAAESVAAVIVEPVLGEGGFYVPPIEFFTTLQRICRDHGILLIADEIQTGFARTGYMFASEYFGLEPDLLLTAKTLGGGLPLAGVTGRAEIMDHTAPGSLGGTFGGNPLACEAALAAIETIERDKLCHRAQILGERFRERALAWRDRYSFIGDVRGLGAMQAIEFAPGPGREGLAQSLARYSIENGVILLTAGTDSNVVRLLMPLVITDAEFEEALNILNGGIESLEASAVARTLVRPALN
jgi:4-aminobutyrate aminotransferase/(S)-3-amino-2-methylpropionate transaminase